MRDETRQLSEVDDSLVLSGPSGPPRSNLCIYPLQALDIPCDLVQMTLCWFRTLPLIRLPLLSMLFFFFFLKINIYCP